MHDKPIPESAGKLDSEKRTTIACRKCGKQTVVLQSWESDCGGYEDDKFSCKSCGHVWWVEGPDA